MEVPFALSIHKFVNSIGADAGFAAFVCVAVIGLLYFAQARETATLRERLEDAHDRIGGLEARIAQLMHLQSARQAVPTPAAPGRVTPPPVAARPMGSAIASVRRVPAATAAGTGTTPPGTPFPVAPVGMGAPALASATKLIPDPVLPATTSPASDDTILVPAAAVKTANGNGEAPAVPAGISPRATAATAPPRVQIRADGSGGGANPRRAVGAPPTRPLGEARFDVFEQERGSRSRGRRLPLAIGLVALVVIVGGVVAILSSGGSGASNPTGNGSNTTAGKTKTSSTTGKHKGTKHKGAPFVASSVSVAVLNGTAKPGLAADVSTALSGAGYQKGSVTNAAAQSEPKTTVYFTAGYKSAADHVAKQLKLTDASVKPATQAAIHSCATSPTGTTTSCSGNVIVSVGQDRASMASTGSSSAG
jgi:LytR cell envelope-related transcriptional attenuator